MNDEAPAERASWPVNVDSDGAGAWYHAASTAKTVTSFDVWAAWSVSRRDGLDEGLEPAIMRGLD